jgi:hypothetical protein
MQSTSRNFEQYMHWACKNNMLVFGLQNSCMVHFFLLLPRFQNVVCFEKIAFKTYYILERRQYFFRHITLEKHSQNSGLETEKY